MSNIYLYLENGIFIKAVSFGADTTLTGEMIFNTSMSGYQEILSDPSYAGQFVVFTMPEIGIVGINDKDIESLNTPHVKGIIVRKYNEFHSNYRSSSTLGAYLKSHNIIGICGIDTRYLSKLVRNNGAINIIASTTISDPLELKKMLEDSASINEISYVSEVSTRESFIYDKINYDFSINDYPKIKHCSKKIAVIDFGIKRNILNELSSVGLECIVFSSNFNAEELILKFNNSEIGGVFLSNGPGNPSLLTREISEIKKLISAQIPMFGICLGHQLLSIAHGYPTYKLEFGHHGANHPVKNLLTGKVEITSQNHIYSVPENIIEVAEVTHINLFDSTIEGLRYKNAPIISIQHHPEASPGPKDSNVIFREFFNMVRAC